MRRRDLRLSALRGHRIESEHLTRVGFPRPLNSNELRDLAYSGHSVFLALHLSGEGLDSLEDTERRLIEREVEFALVEAGPTSVDFSESAGIVELCWEWPRAQFVNGAEIEVRVVKQSDQPGRPTDLMSEPITKWFERHMDQPEYCATLRFPNYDVDCELRFRFRLAVRSPSFGRYYPGHEELVTAVPVPATSQPTQFGDADPEPGNRLEVPGPVFVDPNEPKMAWPRPLNRRAVLLVAGATVLLALIVSAVWVLAF